ncbi:cytochrome c550 [Bacillus sinesaloumensis]|uniref:cytochrome c550 n=1 Tax=Litchfieldia sinesaloumensis TaxID=1926280 RepID=UPI0009888DAB|nr:cytochrome c [Bacillus sinesaloumensis]
MKKNPLIPFALIAVFGIGLIFLLGFIGLGNMDEMANAGEEAPETAAASPEELYQGKCSSCHGADLSGGAGPALKGTELSVEEIENVVTNGKGIMPPNLVSDPAQLEELATWLTEQK